MAIELDPDGMRRLTLQIGLRVDPRAATLSTYCKKIREVLEGLPCDVHSIVNVRGGEEGKFATKEGIEIEVQIFEDGLVDEQVVLDFVVYVRVPGYELTDHNLVVQASDIDLEVQTIQRRD